MPDSKFMPQAEWEMRRRVYSPPVTAQELYWRKRIKKLNESERPNLEPRSHDDYERMDARFKE